MAVAADPNLDRVASKDDTMIRWQVLPPGLSEPTGQAKEERKSDPLPSESALRDAREDVIFNEDSEPIKLENVLTAPSNIVVFIRHFRCGLCQDFLVYLTLQDRMKPYVLQEANAKLIIIGCGSPVYIRPYKDLLNLPYDVYANPSGSLYKTLGMRFQQGLNRNVRSFYFHGTFMDTIWKGILRGLRLGKLLAPAGNVQQLGGEFVFSRKGRKCRYAHCMRHTADHAPAQDLLLPLGADYLDMTTIASSYDGEDRS